MGKENWFEKLGLTQWRGTTFGLSYRDVRKIEGLKTCDSTVFIKRDKL